MIDDMLRLLELGGPVVLVLIVMSVGGLAIVLYKLADLRHFSATEFVRLNTLVKALRNHGELSDLEQDRSPMAHIFCNASRWVCRDDIDQTLVREELSRQANNLLVRVRQYVSVLELIAYLAPLLGLLGTVLGIIDVFSGLAAADGESETELLAVGIWQALVTTAAGLCVAIPFASLHAMFESRVFVIGNRIEDQLAGIYTLSLFQTEPAFQSTERLS